MVQTNGQPAGTDEIERWQSLVQTADKEAMTTLGDGATATSSSHPFHSEPWLSNANERSNLGAIRRAIKNLEWPA